MDTKWLVNLMDFRKRNNLTQERMAEVLGISYGYYIKIEYGQRNPSYGFLSRFASKFPRSNLRAIFFED